MNILAADGSAFADWSDAFDIVPEAMLLVDGEGRVAAANPAARERLNGAAPGEALASYVEGGERGVQDILARLRGGAHPLPFILPLKDGGEGERIRATGKRLRRSGHGVHYVIRIPPVRVSEPKDTPNPKLDKVAELEHCILFEDDRILVINKPSGTAVHGGSGLNFGLIEGLRALRPDAQFMELVHRLDRDTSGCIIIAKKRSALRHLHAQLRDGQMDKRYQALVAGQWPENRFKVKAPLLKNVLQSGERLVSVNENGKPSETRYRILTRYEDATLVEASPITGRTHQIRVHCLHAGHPIACDPKYGDEQFDDTMRSRDLKRLFLHAASIQFIHPGSGETVRFQAPLDEQLTRALKQLNEV